MIKNSVLTAKKTQHFAITKIGCCTLFKETIAVYTENQKTPEIKNTVLVIFKAVGTYSYHWVLKVKVNFREKVIIREMDEASS
jgi:hypothetical protein